LQAAHFLNDAFEDPTKRFGRNGTAVVRRDIPEHVVFAVGHSTLYMGLLPPENDKGYAQPGSIGAPYARVVGVNKG
jgi:hypothetical protein